MANGTWIAESGAWDLPLNWASGQVANGYSSKATFTKSTTGAATIDTTTGVNWSGVITTIETNGIYGSSWIIDSQSSIEVRTLYANVPTQVRAGLLYQSRIYPDGSVTLSGDNRGLTSSLEISGGTLIIDTDYLVPASRALVLYSYPSLDVSSERTVSARIEVYRTSFTFLGSYSATFSGALARTGYEPVGITVSANTLTISGQLVNHTDFEKMGAGTLALTNTSNQISGRVLVNGGTLQCAASSCLGNATDVYVNNAILTIPSLSNKPLELGTYNARASFTGADATFAGAITTANTAANSLEYTATTGTTTLASIAGIGSVTFRSSAIVQALNNGNTVATGTLTVWAGTPTGVISGAADLVKTTSGTLTLTQPQTYTGSTTISGGKLKTEHISAIPGAVIIPSGGTLQMSPSVGARLTLASTLNMTGGRLQFGGT